MGDLEDTLELLVGELDRHGLGLLMRPYHAICGFWWSSPLANWGLSSNSMSSARSTELFLNGFQ